MTAYKRYFGLLSLTFLLLAAALQNGCVYSHVAGVAAAGTAGAIGGSLVAGVAADQLLKGLEGVDHAKSTLETSQNAPEKLLAAKKIAVALTPPQVVELPPGPFTGDPAKLMEDSVCARLMTMGYHVLGREALGIGQTPAPEGGRGGSTLEAAKRAGADLLVGGSASYSFEVVTKVPVLFGGSVHSEMRSLVTAATVWVTDCSEGNRILQGSISYKRGKPIEVAAADVATVLSRARDASASKSPETR